MNNRLGHLQGWLDGLLTELTVLRFLNSLMIQGWLRLGAKAFLPYRLAVGKQVGDLRFSDQSLWDPMMGDLIQVYLNPRLWAPSLFCTESTGFFPLPTLQTSFFGRCILGKRIS